MSLRERFQYGNLNTKRYLPWRSPVPLVEFEEGQTGRIVPSGFNDQREHSLTLRCYVTFWANTAQLPNARKSAERLLMDTLYRDLFAHLSLIENLVSSGDQSEAYEAILNLRREFMTP